MDKKTLVVIVGAGASFDCCASQSLIVQPEWRPCLTKDLFAPRPPHIDIMRKYPLAQQVAVDIREHAGNDAFSLEKILRERYRDSDHAEDKARFRSVSLYLQKLLLEMGANYTRQADNYDLLVTRTLREADNVVFISLNYDTLLDRSLHALHPLTQMDSYVSADKWILVKPHGSVNWGYRVKEETGEALDPLYVFHGAAEQIESPTHIEFLGWNEDVRKLHIRSESFLGPHTYFYPAIAVPVGSTDELACPDEHIAALKSRLFTAERLNLLIVGYSGLDNEVLTILKESGKPIGRLLVANGDLDSSVEAGHRLNEAFGNLSMSEASFFDGGFSDLTQSARLDQYLARL